MSISAHWRAPRKRTRDERDLANHVVVVEEEEEQKENLASTSTYEEKQEAIEEDNDDSGKERRADDVIMEEEGVQEEKMDVRPKSHESAVSSSLGRRKLTPKRLNQRRRCYSESFPPNDAAVLIQSEDDLLYGPQLLLDESALQEGHQIPMFDADDIDNILGDLETLNIS
uniref:Uncharacterized protein n=1 Tax=Steinernema glaseri TaxID=37863 RepID=A0A1I8ASL4_9BILA